MYKYNLIKWLEIKDIFSRFHYVIQVEAIYFFLFIYACLGIMGTKERKQNRKSFLNKSEKEKPIWPSQPH
jgi:hypothetical protein